MTEYIRAGMKVTYTDPRGYVEHGIVKRVDGTVAYVVYQCGGDWDRYAIYHALPTKTEDLRIGWDKPDWMEYE